MYHYFLVWRLLDIWEAMHIALRKTVRWAVGRDAQPSTTTIGSQSIKATSVGGLKRGFAGCNKEHLQTMTDSASCSRYRSWATEGRDHQDVADRQTLVDWYQEDMCRT